VVAGADGSNIGPVGSTESIRQAPLCGHPSSGSEAVHFEDKPSQFKTAIRLPREDMPTMAENQAPQRPQSAVGEQQATAGNATAATVGGSIAADSRSSVRGTSSLERRTQLATPRGRTEIADAVVAKVAGLAAREVEGVHAMGKGALRALGALRDRLPVGSNTAATQGVRVEVGERQAAIDLDLVMDYGVSIPDVAQAVRDNVIDRVERTTGLEVVEVNITVDDIWLGDEDESDQRQQQPRVA
jgi:uncharacterized alkaline shock family protein YloU